MTETKESKTSSPYNRIYPDWFDGKHLNEVLFGAEFLRDHPMKSINGAFFTTEGRITNENQLRKEIYDRIKPYFTQGITKRVTALIDTMRMECYSPDLPLHHDRIHVKNGHCSLTEISRLTRITAGIVCRSATIRMRQSRRNGLDSSRSCLRATTF